MPISILKLIDELILAGNSETASQVLRQQYHELLEQNDHYALTSSLQHYSDLLQQSSVDASDAEKDEELQAALNAMREHLYSLRRLLFFVVADPQHDDLQSLLQTSALTRLTATGSTGATGAIATATNNSQAGAGAVNDFDDFSGFDDPFADPSADPFATDDLSFMEHGSTINGGLGYGGLFDSDYSSMNYDLSLDQGQGQPTDGHQPQGPAPFFAPYLLTGYPFALQYLALKHEVLQQAAPMLAALAQQGAQGYHGSLNNYSCPVAIRRCLEIAKTLIVGLNRAFTNLMLMKGAANTLYITTSNKLNPTAPSIIYDTQRFCVPVDYSGSKADTSIRFERSPSNMMELVFHQNLSASLSWGAGGNGGIVSGQPMFNSSRMLITPKLFEYLMALASGKVGLSFSSECNNDLIAFKASIDSMIMESTPLVQPSNDSQNMLNSVFICKLDPSGGFNWN